MTPRPTGHHGEKPSETLVRFIVEQTLGVRVCCYDDRGGRSRPDAIIHHLGGVPLEIVSDPLQSENQLLSALEKIGRRAEFDGLTQGYRVCLTRNARINDLSWLEQTLRQLEDPEQRDPVTGQTDNYLFVEPDKRLLAGEVRFTSGSGGGRPIRYGPDVISAASAVLAQKQYADVARKLNAYGGVERHAVVVVDDEKDSTFSWLRRATPADVDQLPAPELTAEITHLWITPRYIPGLTMAWSAKTGWQAAPWDWGHPIDALDGWDDPACPDDHTARNSNQRD